jgi:FtsH-binding integral membrane protein
MSYARQLYANDLFAADAAIDERIAFIRRTYLHLGGALLAFVGLEVVFLNTPPITQWMLGVASHAWWLVLLAFIAVSWVAERWAHSDASPSMQYAGLALFTVAEAIIFVPLLFIAQEFGGPHVIPAAGILTATIFGGLTLAVMITRQDFSFLRNILWIGTLAALGLIVASLFIGFSLGTIFVGFMIAMAAGWILYDTSNVLHHYRTDQHVGAALALFSSFALLLWYIVQLLMSFSGDD